MKNFLSVLLVLALLLSLATIFSGCEDETPSKKQRDNVTSSSTGDIIDDNQGSDTTTTTRYNPDNLQTTQKNDMTTGTSAIEQAPVSLGEIEKISGASNYYNNQVSDSYGNSYPAPYFLFESSGCRGFGSESYSLACDSTEFKIGGQYRYLTGKFFAQNKQNEAADVELMIYADDELVYYSGNINRRTKAVEFAIDIGYCDILRIESRSFDHSNYDAGIVLVDAFVYESFSGNLTTGEYFNTDLTHLVDLHAYDLDCDVKSGAIKDSYGNNYKGFYISLCSWGDSWSGSSRTEYAEYVLNGDYNYFSATIFTPSEQEQSFTINFMVYADDELIYESKGMSRNTKAADICLDISGCEMLRIVATSPSFSSADPTVIVMNPMVSTARP